MLLLRPKSLFTFDFEGKASGEPVAFDEMFQAARVALGSEYVKVYAHSVADVAKRSSLFKRVTVPHPCKVVEIVVVVATCALREEDIVPTEAALLRPVWHVALAEREVRPAPVQGRLSWATARQVVIEPGECVRVS